MALRMFTGLVQTQGQLQSRNARGVGFVLSIRHDFGTLELGESIAVNGACLTVISFTVGRFDADCSKETAERTNLGRLALGSSVHLERALRVGDRLGGHFVSGHVDALVSLVNKAQKDEAQELTFELPQALCPFVAEKGSVTLDGVSLTVNRVSRDQFTVMVVPHTLRATHLGSLRRGDGVNLEVDVLSRYLVHAARASQMEATTSAPTDQESSPERDLALRRALARAGML
jgi:riboflavin synthase